MNTLLFILKILQTTGCLLKSQNDGFVDFPVVLQDLYGHVVLRGSVLYLCLVLCGLAWDEFLC